MIKEDSELIKLVLRVQRKKGLRAIDFLLVTNCINFIFMFKEKLRLSSVQIVPGSQSDIAE